MNTTAASLAQAASGSATRTKKRFGILAVLFVVTTINYADRATLSIAGPALSMGWTTHAYGWPAVFVVMGLLGIVVAAVWMKTVYTPKTHPSINQAELDYIAAGGALVNMDHPGNQSRSFAPNSPKLSYIRQLLSNRMLMGVYVGQYCITTLTYFFQTWFPVCLVRERGMSILNAGVVAALPAICGFAGGVLGGVISDALLRRGKSSSAT